MSLKVLVTGCNGFIGSSVTKSLVATNQVIGWGRGNCRLSAHRNLSYQNIDLANSAEVEIALRQMDVNIVIHCAALSQVEACENDTELCEQINVECTRLLAQKCKDTKAKMVFFSSDFVFSGKDKYVTPEVVPNPISIYGQSKFKGEQIVSKLDNFAIIRPVLVYGYSPAAARGNFYTWVVDSLRKSKPLFLVSDQLRTPSYIEDVVVLVNRIVENDSMGFFNMGGKSRISILEFGLAIAEANDLDVGLISGKTSHNIPGADLRPLNSCFEVSYLDNMFNLVPLDINQGIKRLKSEY